MKESQKYHYLISRNIRLAYVTNFFKHVYFFLPIWYAFETKFATPATLGIIYAVSHLTTVALELPTGALADLIGRKKTIILGLFLESMAWILISQSTSSHLLWAGYILVGVANSLVSGADEALNYDSLKELKKENEYAKFSSNIGLLVRSAIIIGTFAGGYIYNFSFRLPYILVGINILVSAFVSFFLTEPKIDSEKFSINSYLRQTKLGFREIVKSTDIKLFSLYYLFVGGLSWYFMFFLNMAYATEAGFSTTKIGQMFAIIYFLASIVNIILTRIKNLDRNTVYILLPLLMFLGYIPGYWATKTLAPILIFMVQFVGMARFSLLNQFANLEIDSKYRATAMSSLNMGVSLVAAILSSGTGSIIEKFGAHYVMSLMGVITFVSLLPVTIRLTKKSVMSKIYK